MGVSTAEAVGVAAGVIAAVAAPVGEAGGFADPPHPAISAVVAAAIRKVVRATMPASYARCVATHLTGAPRSPDDAQ